MRAEASDRVGSLLDFLQAFHAQRHPPVHDISKYGLELIRPGDLPVGGAVRLSPGAESWLCVDFVELPPRPDVPDAIVRFVGSSTSISPYVRPTVEVADDATDQDLDDAAEAERWVTNVWAPWSADYSNAARAKDFYRRLFEVRERLNNDRDGLELVWGFGRLVWEVQPGDAVDHPLLTFPVEVEIDAVSNQLAVRPAGALAVESVFLSDIALDDQAGFNAVRASLEAQDEASDPWDETVRLDLVRRIVRTLDHDAVVEDQVSAAHLSPDAHVDVSWMLFLRRRSPDYQGFLDTMRELYRDGAIPPDPLTALVIEEPSQLFADTGHDGDGRAADPLLLPLPTNEEQQRILTLAQKRPGVTVQGPPGTGKSHTIANIISHYVAHGKRVLVVAEKEQALRVLAEKIPAGIRDLTVSVLGADEEGRRGLESAVHKIQTHVTGLDLDFADDQIVRLTAELDRVDRRVAELTDRVLRARSAEASQLEGHWLGHSGPTPSVAGQLVAARASELGYIPDHLAPSLPCPLTSEDLADFVELLRRVGLETAEACALVVPAASDLPTGARLVDLFAQQQAHAAALDGIRAYVADLGRADAAPSDTVYGVVQTVVAELEWRQRCTGTWLERTAAQLTDPMLAASWPRFASDVRAEREQILTLSAALEAHTVVVPDTPPPAFEVALAEARSRLSAKGKLGMFAGGSKQALDACSVDGRPPSTADDVDLCLQALRRDALRRQLVTRWANRVLAVSGPTLDAEWPEGAVGQHLTDLDLVLGAGRRWTEISSAVASIGIRPPVEPSVAALTQLVEVLRVIHGRQQANAVGRELDGVRRVLRAGTVQRDASPLWGLLADDLDNRRTNSWDEHRAECERLHILIPDARRLRDLRDRLHSAAPTWTADIVANPAAAGNPSALAAAWQWRQLDTWLSTIRAAEDPAALQHQLEELSNERRRKVADLVAERAWRRLADNLGDTERAALNSYLYAVKRFGKTGGKFAARWLAEIRTALNEAKDAVPVWIMTTNRALTSFRPAATPPFDLLVVDEASQIGLDAVPLLSLARSTIIVGDDKQTSPENVGADQQAFFNLLDRFLTAIPKYKVLFDLNASLYDLAFQKFPGEIMLTEHFRSLPSIIDFSNTHIYNRRIIPLRDQPPHPGWTALGAIKVVDGYRQGNTNPPEADAIVDLIASMCDQPDYDGMDFGVVSLLGSDQSKLIWDKLYDRLGPEVIAARRIRCGEPANFQGDERDVIILSLVVATDPNNPGVRIGAMTGLPAERRINVAASRARDQLWVVHSVEPDRFPNGDLRGALIRHCQDPGALEATLDKLEEHCESDFERQVLRRIVARGYTKIRAQYDVGRYRVDLVVEGPDARLAVECDGDRWHGPDVWHKDRARQQVLERAGWTFERIRGSSFYRDPDGALKPLWQRLQELGIPTGSEWVTNLARSTVRTVITTRADDAIERTDNIDPDGAAPHTVAQPPLEGAQAGGGFLPPPTPGLATATLPPPTGPRAPAPPSHDRPATSLPPPADSVLRPVPPIDSSAGSTTGLAGNEPTPTVPERSVRAGAALAPYHTWAPEPLKEVAYARPEDIIAGLVAIVAAEGPIHALRAYQLYVKASGGERVGKEIRHTLNKATNRALRSRALAQLHDAIPGQAEKTLYLPGTAGVVVRELGPRSLTDVPRSEIATLVRQLGAEGSDLNVQRAILNAYGLTRLTERARTYLDECLAYEWTV